MQQIGMEESIEKTFDSQHSSNHLNQWCDTTQFLEKCSFDLF